MRAQIHFATDEREQLIDSTRMVQKKVDLSRIKNGRLALFALGATAAIMLQENGGEGVQSDVIQLLHKLIPSGIWKHDKQDGIGDAHLKAGVIGPSETVPLVDGLLGLPRWQNRFSVNLMAHRKIAALCV